MASACVFCHAGGLLARTDACKDLDHLPGCKLVLGNLSVQGNNATAGGGLLLTNISSRVVELQGCSAGTALNMNTAKTCLQDNVNGVTHRFLKDSSRRRTLLAINLMNSATNGGDLLLTSAATLDCGSELDMPTLNRRLNRQLSRRTEECSSPIKAAPGLQFNPLVYLLDGLGNRVQTGIYDASMPMQVRRRGGWR